MIEMMQIPKLRFKEFSKDWKRKPFKELTKINQGLQIPISERYSEKIEDSYFYITNEFLKEGSGKKYFIKNPSKSVICDKSDILMTRTGNTGKVVTNVSGAFHNNFFKITYPDNIDKSFLYYFLNLYTTQNKIKRLAGTSTIPDLNHSDFYRINMVFPEKIEQNKIASFLSSVDKKTDQLQQKKTLLEQYKKGVMQKLFSQELRFKPDNGNEYPDWESERLGEMTERKICYGVVQPGIKDKNGVKFIRGGDIYSGVISKELRIISKEITDKYQRTYLKGGELIMSLVGYPGETAIVPKELSGANLARQVGLIDLKAIYSSEYIHFYISSDIGKRRLLSKIIGSAQQVINIIDLKKLIIPIPKFEEQTKIANFLSAIDKKIQLVTTQLENTQQFKKGLLQQMFV